MALPAFPVARRPVDEGGIFWPADSLARGRPRALAAFVERPQAACSNRRYILSLERAATAVNENYPLFGLEK
jgi:hypothetical protein